MMLRRAVWLLTAAFMFHLNVAASDNACAKHVGGEEHSSQTSAMADMDMAPIAAINTSANTSTSAATSPHVTAPRQWR